jgi:two-component system, sensor histidine kinase
MISNISRTVDILLVDDREDGLIALEAVLSDYKNYNLVKARSGREAIDLLPQFDFAAILLDVQMPGMDGFQTAEVIRNMIRFQAVPIIFVTAINKDERYIARGYEKGAVDYIFKPFEPIILKSKVAVFAQLHLQKREIVEQSRLLQEREALHHRAQVQSLELENLKRYRDLADSVPHLIWRTGPDGILEYHNNQWAKYTGLSISESLGEGWQKVVHPADLKVLLEKWKNGLAKGQEFEVEGRIRRFDGVYRWHWVKAVPQKNSEGKIESWIGTSTDIDDRRQYEKKLIDAQKLAEAASLAKTQFLANMSHEIRTPLNAIIGFTDLMLDPSLSNEEKFNNLSIVRRNGYQLLKIVDEVLDISKVEAGGLEIENMETNLVTVVTEVKSLMNVLAIRKNIDLKFEVDKWIPDKVWSDSTRLRQILLNIVGNALKFTEKGHVHVIFRYVKKGQNGGSKDYLQFVVKDSGVGLDKAAIEKIFTPFSQADSSTTRLYGGTGLGLALARKLARAMGGDIWLDETAPGKGSTFVIEVLAPPTLDHKKITHFFNSEPEDQVATENLGQNLKGRKILLVEDAVDNQLLITRFLQKSGAIIDIANNGEEGVKKALANDYELVLMDIQMPLLDGYEATSRLRQAGFKKPILALTAHALNEEREKCLLTGCNGHLTKPINRQQLIENISKYVDATPH